MTPNSMCVNNTQFFFLEKLFWGPLGSIIVKMPILTQKVTLNFLHSKNSLGLAFGRTKFFPTKITEIGPVMCIQNIFG